MPPSRASRFLRLFRRSDEVGAGWPSPFGDDDDGEMLARLLPLADLFANALVVERDFGNQNHVGAAGQTGIDGDPAGVAAHHFQHHHPPMALGRAVQPVDGIGGASDGRIEAERHHRGRQVVVDRLGHADDGDSVLEQLLSDRERAVAADRDETDQAEFLAAAFGLVQQFGGQLPRFAVADFGGEFALVGGAQNRAAADEQPIEQLPFQHLGLLRWATALRNRP